MYINRHSQIIPNQSWSQVTDSLKASNPKRAREILTTWLWMGDFYLAIFISPWVSLIYYSPTNDWDFRIHFKVRYIPWRSTTLSPTLHNPNVPLWCFGCTGSFLTEDFGHNAVMNNEAKIKQLIMRDLDWDICGRVSMRLSRSHPWPLTHNEGDSSPFFPC